MDTIAIEQIDTIIERLTNDRAFRAKYCQDPDGTLESHLTSAEIRAIKTGDGDALRRMGCGKSWDDFTASLCVQSPSD